MKISSVQICDNYGISFKENRQSAEKQTYAQISDYKPAYYIPVFGSAAKLNLKYILDTHQKELPESILVRVLKLVELETEKLPTLKDLHDYVYKHLQSAMSLDDIRKYSEFANVTDLKDYRTRHSKAIASIKQNMPIENFTLDFIKKLYLPTKMDDLVKIYGVNNRSSLEYLAESLGIKKLSGMYLNLYRLSDEVENARFAKQAQSYVRTPEARKKCNERAVAAHRTPEYRAKKRQEMIDFYKRNPEVAEKTSKISKMTWDNCPEVKEAFGEYRKFLDQSTKRILTKGLLGEKMNSFERKVFGGTMKEFWESHPQMRKIYQERRIEVIEKLKKSEI